MYLRLMLSATPLTKCCKHVPRVIRHPRYSQRHTTLCASSADQLVDWVLSNGGKVQGVAVAAESSQGYGLIATQVCKKGAVAVKLPKACQLTYGSSTDPQLLGLIEKVPPELWGARLALQLLAERLAGEDSHFASYIQNLPVGVEGVPIFFSPQAINLLQQWPPVLSQVTRRCRWLAAFAGQELAAAQGYLAGVDANALGWAMAICSSRAFRTKGPDQPACLLPLVDMCNHSFQPNAKVRPSSKGGMEMFLLREVKPGEAISISYGNLPNDFLLLDYGFIVENNPHDRLQLRFDLSFIEIAMAYGDESSTTAMPLTLKPEVQKLLAALRLLGPQANLEVSFGYEPLVDQRLLTAARVLSVKSVNELKRIQLERLADFGGKPALSAASEGAALRLLSNMATMLLMTFKTTVEEDMQLLSAAAKSDEQLALRLRIEKKKIAHHAIAQLTLRLREVEGN